MDATEHWLGELLIVHGMRQSLLDENSVEGDALLD